jgi:hypothetical protein
VPDADGYPTRAEKIRLRKLADGMDFEATAQYLRSIWWSPEWGITRSQRLLGQKAYQKKPGVPRYRRWRISTGGWSGNEELIGLLQPSWW